MLCHCYELSRFAAAGSGSSPNLFPQRFSGVTVDLEAGTVIRGTLGVLASTVVRSLVTITILLTSAYFFLAYIPYTNFFLIQAPPYHWLAWFTRYAAWLYCAALILFFLEAREFRRTRPFLAVMCLQVVIALSLVIGRFTQRVQSDWKAFLWSLAILLPFLVWETIRVRKFLVRTASEAPSFSYFNVILAAAIVAVLSAGGVLIEAQAEMGRVSIGKQQLDLMIWMLAAHLCVAVLAISLLNAVLLLAARFGWTSSVLRRACCLVAGAILLAIAFVRYFQDTLTFHDWQLYAYVVPFAAALSCSVATILWPLFDAFDHHRNTRPAVATTLLLLANVALAAVALYVPKLIGGADWNSIIQYSFNTLLWLVMSVSIYLLRPCKRRYTGYAIVAAILVAAFTYFALEFSALAWADSLGSTPAEIEAQVREYSSVNASFGMMYATLHPARSARCEGFCRILRQCTNMRDTVARRDLQLVHDLRPVPGPKPNIFIIVVDSLRPDYLGAYNSSVDYTPNLDEFVRDSVVMKKAYTSYAGTTLSEASIFAGAHLLHSHYSKPFSRLNSLAKLASTDGYRFVVSYDTVLRQLMDPSDAAIKLDSDKPWNEIELANTFRQLQPMFDAQRTDKVPIFLFTQPINVHQGTANRVAEVQRDNWQQRPGLNLVTTYRVHQVDNILGKVFADMKARGIYDNSIIILTSDHGEGFADSACQGHNISLCPEVVRIPLIIHLPKSMAANLVYDDEQVATLPDIAPTLYYLLGHRSLVRDPILGRPLFAATREELESYRRQDLLFVSDVRAAYGLITDNGRYMYVTYDSPPESFYYDLSADPDGRHNIVTQEITQRANKRIVDYLFMIGNYYGYTPTGGRDGL